MINSTATSSLPSAGIQAASCFSALGETAQQLRTALGSDENTLTLRDNLLPQQSVYVGAYSGLLDQAPPVELSEWDSRNLRLALAALAPIEEVIAAQTAGLPRKRLAIIIGTSTSGVGDNEQLLREQLRTEQTAQLSHARQRMNATAWALQRYLNWQGPCYTVSTACSSSAKALAAGQRLLAADLADAVLVGGIDTLARLTLNGFGSLESLSKSICQPCGAERDGINIGEAAAWFLLTPNRAAVQLIAAGESMDAWHISAPHPEGLGAANAMQGALDAAQLRAADIDYVNLHGTATPQNDAMEIKALQQVFGAHSLPVSSTKHKTGHCLGAAGAMEAYICYQLLLDQQWLPLHTAAAIDPQLSGANYVRNSAITQPLRRVMSNSFAFGGSNISLIFGSDV